MRFPKNDSAETIFQHIMNLLVTTVVVLRTIMTSAKLLGRKLENPVNSSKTVLPM